jgi:tetratricopeptide (TPR) repeat protein
MDEDRIRSRAKQRRGEAWALFQRNKFTQALAAFESSVALYAQIDDRAGQSSILIEMGQTALRLNDYALTYEYYRRARTVFQGMPIPFMHDATMLNDLKKIYLKEQDFEQALKALLDLRALQRKHDSLTATILKELGEVTAQLGHVKDSDTYFAQALWLATNATKITQDILWAWGMAHYRRGQQARGLHFCEMALLVTISQMEGSAARPDNSRTPDVMPWVAQSEFKNLYQQFQVLKAEYDSQHPAADSFESE